MLTINKAVTIANPQGRIVTITAGSSDAYAAEITADGATIDGLTLIGGSNPTGVVNISSKSEVKNCILQDNGYNPTLYAVNMATGAKLRACTVTMTNGDPAAVRSSGSNGTYPDSVLDNTFNLTVTSAGSSEIAVNVASGSYVVLSGNKILFTNQGGSLHEGIHIAGDYCRIANNTIDGANKAISNDGDHTTIATNLLTGNTYGVYVATSNYLDINHNTIVRASCLSSTYGIWIDAALGMTYSFQNNLVENCDTGLYFGTTVEGGWTILHNAFWSDSGGGCGTGSNRTLTSTQLKTNLEPLFCNAHEAPVGEYTQRIDSGTAPGNNGWGDLVGAFPVACMYGTLARTSTFGGGSLDVLGDTTIPEADTLSLNADAVLIVDDADNQSSGGDVNEVQINVKGNLTTNGTSGHEAIFRSVTGTAGAWDGIVIPNQASNAKIDLTYTTIQDAETGISALYPWASVGLGHVTVDHCQSYGLYLFTIGAGTHVVGMNGVTVDMDAAPTGVYLAGYQATNIVDLHITGNSSGMYGLHVEAAPYSGGAPMFKDCYASGLDQGKGIFVHQYSPEFQHLDVTDCKWGVYLQGTDIPRLQPYLNHTPAQNYIADCETGLYVTSDPAPDVDSLLIFACTTGLYTDSTSTGSYTKVVIDADSTSASVGFKAWSTAAHTFRHGKILHFDNEGVNVNPAGLVDLGTSADPGNNQIYSDSVLTPTAYVKCRNRVAGLGDVKAEKNYWGQQTPPANMFTAGVDYTPWLGVPPASAPGMEMVTLPLGLLAIGPNPMRTETAISFSIPYDSRSVSLKVYDLNGRLVQDLLPKGAGPGPHQIAWDGRDTAGRRTPTGVYFIRYRDNQTDQSRKVVRLP